MDYFQDFGASDKRRNRRPASRVDGCTAVQGARLGLGFDALDRVRNGIATTQKLPPQCNRNLDQYFLHLLKLRLKRCAVLVLIFIVHGSLEILALSGSTHQKSTLRL